MIAAGGIVMESRVGYTKNDHPYGAFLLEARGGTIQCMLWSAELKKYGPIVDDREFRIVKGRIDQRGHQRSLTVKRVVKPGDEDWKVSIKVSGIQPSEVLRIAAHYPGDHELLLEHAGNLARLKSSVQACPGLVGDIRDKGGEVELCL
jgi:DNA polymerase III alpha subunit